MTWQIPITASYIKKSDKSRENTGLLLDLKTLQNINVTVPFIIL